MAYDFANLQRDLADLRTYRVTRFILSPQQWERYQERVGLQWSAVQFGPQYVSQVPNDQIGVYSFVASPGIANHPALAYPMYVGMTAEQSFRTRYEQYLQEPNKRKPRPAIVTMLTCWPRHLYFFYAPIQDVGVIKQVEDDLLSALLPPYNTIFPATIRAVVDAALR